MYVMCFSDLFVGVGVFLQCVRVMFVYRICVCNVRSVSMCARRIWCMLFFSGKSVRHVCGMYVCGVCVVYVFHVRVSCMCQMCIL